MSERQTVFGIDARIFAVATLGGALTLIFGIYTSFVAFQRDITAELRIRTAKLEAEVSELKQEVSRQKEIRSAVNDLALDVFLAQCRQEEGTFDASLTCIRPGGTISRFRAPFPDEESTR